MTIEAKRLIAWVVIAALSVVIALIARAWLS